MSRAFAPRRHSVAVAHLWGGYVRLTSLDAPPRLIPRSWNEQFSELRDYLGHVWYLKQARMLFRRLSGQSRDTP